MNRRLFLQAGAAGLLLPGARAQAKPRRVGVIGPGWYGKADLFRLIQIEPVEVVALCDVDKQMLANAAEMTATRQKSRKKPRMFADYREMLKQEQMDIVLVAPPDHWHALPMIEAVKAGADVYVQKPISVDVIEGQAMLAAARKYNRVVQVGTQRRSTPHIIEARDRIMTQGLLGKIAQDDLSCY
jgi:predicted dehydrogenase